jgi:Fur family transcriptional regulator, ferric uptake regulator
MTPELLAEVRKNLEAFFTRKGLRRTNQRTAIIEAAFSTEAHFTAEELLERSRAIDTSVSRATVYRTLPLLVESGFLKELDLGGEKTTYDPNFVERPHHNHLICVDCHKIIEFEDTNIELLENCITRRLGFSPTNKSVKIEAHCDELLRVGHCDHQKASPPKSRSPKKATE